MEEVVAKQDDIEGEMVVNEEAKLQLIFDDHGSEHKREGRDVDR